MDRGRKETLGLEVGDWIVWRDEAVGGEAVRGCRTWYEGRGDLTARRLPSGCGAGRLTPALGCRAVRGRDADEVEAGVLGEIDFAHAALADLF